MSIERKLAAIVFTDIAGFTELSAKDEENAFALIETQRNVLKPIVKGHGGQWLKEIGDGLLLSFPSSIQAVNCAIAIQDAVRTIDDLKLRIGVHQGDILQKDDDIFGDESIRVDWDNGSTLSMIRGKDAFTILNEGEE